MRRRAFLFGGAAASIATASMSQEMAKPQGASNARYLDSITDAIRYGFSQGASAATNAAAINAAIASFPPGVGGEVILPSGTFDVAADTIAPTRPHVTITGQGRAFSVIGGQKAPTVLRFGSGTVGFDFTKAALGRNYSCLRNLSINGNKACANGVKVYGAMELDAIEVQNCSNAGIWLWQFINQTRLYRVASNYNTKYGLLVGNGTDAGNTIFSVESSDFNSNAVGVRIESAQFARFAAVVCEANTQHGLQLYQYSKPSVVAALNFSNCWFENNGSAGSHSAVTFDSDTHSSAVDTSPHHITFDHCELSAASGAKCIIGTAGQFFRFLNCDTSGAITLATDVYDSGFENRHITGSATITNSGTRNYDTASGVIPIPYTGTLTGCTTTPTGRVNATKSGSMVTIDVPAFTATSTATSKTITGMPAPLRPATQKSGIFIGSDSGRANAIGLFLVGTNGTITLYPGPQVGNWTNSGTFASTAFSFSYTTA